ncbi:hypothetical protein Nepgr_005964 [Nepenthes gracilis]|uniref:Small auxin up regulated protein n=1 Tax=Nepenthes gracilis TaxID=150966 RepID=A0AAD3XGY6_NEPGR|nr:hypothetical protein Nepgr_005964 [Nepenthes gracilis]
MAKGGKLTKLLRKMQSIGRNGGWPRNTSAVTASHADKSDACFSSAAPCDKISGDLQPVYVGKSRRQYLISSEVIQNPLFRELVGRSSSDQFDGLSVGCEVVLFEHLLWMLDNADPQPESLDELVEFYV